ncbi:rRNA adenine N(6)-methyltransferase [Hamiltosporidium magnivora]|uniref:rRNA adenine N(6)-methyltransferase n=1 Tax=Hamiltosporidium magnivora TaxID=148818 RepID=A0A4Q9L7V5_9MICR|nr:rRNA adenine N(6)-methyltransferase [Hamiltosporidium magnivora]
MSNIIYKKKLGQHILKNPGIIDSIIQKSRIKPTDTVLEIGGGTGNLTIKLLEASKKVLCYEKDPRMANELIKRISSNKEYNNKFQLFVGDAIKADFPYFDMCVSNTPYKISSPLIFKLLKYNFNRAVMMFQKEFAERLCAKVGTSSYCRLSVSVQILAKVDIIMKVNKNNFNPPPKVESAVVKIELRHPRPPIDLEEFNKLLRVCFLRKNKTLSGIFKNKSNLNGFLIENCDSNEIQETVISVLEKSGFSDKRASKMDIDDFLLLLLELKKQNINFK